MSLIQRYPDRLKAAVNFYGPDHGSAARVFPISENPRVELLTEFGQFTSACGLTRYLGDVFPDEYRRASFVAEPVHNLVHVDFWSEEGATSVARRGRENIEFLASTDGWFRPVYFYVGPDGALYLVDYYRESIEHPEWMSSEHHHHDSPDLYTGTERGRIFRLVPDIDDPPPPPGRLSLAESSTQDVNNLAPFGWLDLGESFPPHGGELAGPRVFLGLLFTRRCFLCGDFECK